MNVQPSEYQHKITELRQTLSWMDIVLANIADAVAVVKFDGSILFANDAFSELINESRIAVLGKNLNDILQLSPKDKARPNPYYLDTKEQNKAATYRGIYEWRTEIEETVILKLTIRYIFTTSQSVVMLQNITQEYENENISRNFNNLASHQLRTPITAIKTYTHLLVEGYGGELTVPQKEIAETILSSADHTNRILNMLLDLSKLKHQKYKTTIQPVSLTDLFDEIYREVRTEINQKKLLYSIKIPEDIPTIAGDKNAMNEIFSNLLTNAIKYTPAKGTISVKVKRVKDAITVAIKDNGIGIPLSTQSKIYSQFFRADNAVTSSPSGTGLGLYLVKQLVELLGGEILFKSQLNKGTTFWVTLPVNKSFL